MAITRTEFLATRRSLVERLGDWHDSKRWQQFFDSYWKLIHRAARKAGLTESEAQEVVQETLITVAKKIDRLKYDPKLGSFKGWLLNKRDPGLSGEASAGRVAEKGNRKGGASALGRAGRRSITITSTSGQGVDRRGS
jgi:hypothetical protein